MKKCNACGKTYPGLDAECPYCKSTDTEIQRMNSPRETDWDKRLAGDQPKAYTPKRKVNVRMGLGVALMVLAALCIAVMVYTLCVPQINVRVGSASGVYNVNTKSYEGSIPPVRGGLDKMVDAAHAAYNWRVFGGFLGAVLCLWIGIRLYVAGRLHSAEDKRWILIPVAALLLGCAGVFFLLGGSLGGLGGPGGGAADDTFVVSDVLTRNLKSVWLSGTMDGQECATTANWSSWGADMTVTGVKLASGEDGQATLYGTSSGNMAVQEGIQLTVEHDGQTYTAVIKAGSKLKAKWDGDTLKLLFDEKTFTAQ